MLIRKLVVRPVYGHPKDRTTFQRQCSAHGERVLDPLRGLIRSMGKKTVIAIPMPKLKDTQYSVTAVRNAGQLKKKRAAMAPM